MLVLVLFAAYPMSAFASITPWPLNPNEFDVTKEEYGVVIPAGATGAFPLKTPSGATKFMPPEAKGKDFATFDLRFRGTMSPDFYMVTTFGDGYKLTYTSGGDNGRVGVNSVAFNAHRSKGVSIVLYVKKPMTKERYANMLKFSVFEGTGNGGGTGPTNPGGTDPPDPGGTDPPDPGGTDPGGTDPGGTDPGGTDPGGTDPGGTDPGGCICPELCELLPEMLADIRDDLGDLNHRMDMIFGAVTPLVGQLDQIINNTQPLHDDLRTIHNDVAPLHGDLQEIIRQITPEWGVGRPDISVSDYYRPPDIGYRFTDNNTYFRDQGDAATPGPMPAAPEPKNWTFDGKELQPDPQGKRDNQKADPVQQPDPKQQKDQAQQKDAKQKMADKQQMDEKQLADPNQQMDKNMKASPRQILPTPQKKDENMMQKPMQHRENFVTPDPKMQVEHNDYPLRWKSSDYKGR